MRKNIKGLLFYLLIFCTHVGFAQKPCAGIRNDTLTAFKVPKEQMFEAINEDVKIMVNCLGLDSTDGVILTTPVLTTLIAGQALHGEVLVYGCLLDSIEKVRNSPEYKEMKAFTFYMIENENEPVSKEGWKELELVLLEILDDDMLSQVERQVDASIAEGLTYKELFSKVFGTENADPKVSEDEVTSPFDIFHEMEPLDVMLEMTGKNQKPLLLYFNGWGCVNGHRMEESWRDGGVFELIEMNFIPFMGYADDLTAMTNELREKWKVGGEVKTMGKCINNFQEEFLKSRAQPLFAIVSADGEVLATQGYTLDVDEFKSFLKTKVD